MVTPVVGSVSTTSTILADSSGGYIVDHDAAISSFSLAPCSVLHVPTGTSYCPGWKIARSIADR